MPPSLSAILKTLNVEQLSAVEALEGPVLVSAGAGSGKTRVLTYRIACLIAQKKALPHQILAVTFTNKAATEMWERIKGLIKDLPVSFQERMWISTFHSFCARVLRDNKNLYSQGGTFLIYDNKDQLSLVKKIMKDMNINEKIYNPKTFANQIALCKRQCLTPENIDNSSINFYGNRFQELYFKYEKELKVAGAFDFEGLLMESYKLFLKYPELLEKYRNQFLYISVDEYQDTNHIQYLIIKALAEKHRNICVVGDEDQSIYSWRGADISNILNFDKDFSECKTIKLEQNYRSTKNIISAAGALISYNNLRKEKTLFTENPTGDLIQLYKLEDEYKEADLVSRIITSQCAQQYKSYEDFAIFYRTNAQSRVLEDSLRSKNIPYKIIGNLKFYDRLEIKDALAYLRFIFNSKDEVSLKRILNSPKRGIGANTIKHITVESQKSGKSFYEVMTYLSETNQIRGPARAGIMKFIHTINELKNMQNNLSLSDFYKAILEKTGYTQILNEDKSIEAVSRLENLQELGNVISQFELENEQSGLESFLEEITLLTPSDSSTGPEPEGVTLMTLHISKGLEFNNVFITGLEEGLFPLSQNIEEKNIEEERRLAYVGMTRAKKNLYLSWTTKRTKFGKTQYNQASSFLEEIPDKFVQFTSLVPKKSSYFSNKYKRGSYTEDTYLNEDIEDINEDAGDMESPSHSAYQNMYKVGRVVHHPRFGAGKIQKIEGTGEDLKVSVMFNKNQKIKKFIAKYAHLSF